MASQWIVRLFQAVDASRIPAVADHVSRATGTDAAEIARLLAKGPGNLAITASKEEADRLAMALQTAGAQADVMSVGRTAPTATSVGGSSAPPASRTMAKVASSSNRLRWSQVGAAALFGLLLLATGIQIGRLSNTSAPEVTGRAPAEDGSGLEASPQPAVGPDADARSGSSAAGSRQGAESTRTAGAIEANDSPTMLSDDQEDDPTAAPPVAPVLTSDDYSLAFRVDAPGDVSVVFEIPGAFPNPSEFVSVRLNCAGGNGRLLPSETFDDGRQVYERAKSFVEMNPDFAFDGKTLRAQGYSVGCSEGDRLTFTGPTLQEVLELLWTAYDETGIEGSYYPSWIMNWSADGTFTADDLAYDTRVFELLDGDGYRYPNIREGYFRHSLYILATADSLTAAADIDWNNDYVVVVDGPSGLLPLLYDAERYTQHYDASRPTLISASRGEYHGGVWDKLLIDFDAGSFTWWRDEVPPQ